MQLNKFAYHGSRTAGRPARAFVVGNARWDSLDNDALLEIFQHLDDRQLTRMARLDRRTRRVAYAATRAHLGLSASQWDVFVAVLHRRESVLIMGPPGSGKSHLLKVLKERVPNPLVTASTGAAAEKIGAWTFHSALGLGLANKPVKEILKKLTRRQYHGGQPYPQPCQSCECLIVDEVSMLTAHTLDLAKEVILELRGVRKLPQLIVSGDPMQLGAVDAARQGLFYESELVHKLRPYVLTESFRQAQESKFLSILNRARLGNARDADLQWITANACPDVGPDAPRLFCRLRRVWDYNDMKLATIDLPAVEYEPTETGDVPNPHTERADQFSNVLRLKVGARVMLTRNLPEHAGLHNGSCGTVRGVDEVSAYVRFDNGPLVRIRPVVTEYEKHGQVVGTRTEMPLVLAWAVSIHRAQGATLDRMALDLTGSFAQGQAYVALSRVREVHHLELQGKLALSALNDVNKKAQDWYDACAKRSADRAARHRERERRALAQVPDVDDDALAAMMDAFEAQTDPF